MTREYALEVLDTIPTMGDQVDALEMAISALENENTLLDKVLELIDELNDTKALAKATPPGSYLHKTYARRLKGAVKELAGERPEGND